MAAVPRARMLDPVIADLEAEVRGRLPGAPAMPARDEDRRHAARVQVEASARFQIDDLLIHGHVQDVGAGGVFFRCDLLLEIGEAGSLYVGDELEDVKVRVAWVRGHAHELGQGLGLAFDDDSASGERRSLELVLALLDGP